MKPEKKIFIILTPGFPASEADSTCLPMQQQFVKALKKNNDFLDIIVLSFQYPYTVKTYSWFGVTVMPFNGQNKGGIRRLLLRKKIFTALQQITRTGRITGLLSFWYNECARIGSKFAQKNNLQHYCWLLGQDARATNSYPKSLQMPGSEIIALSDFLQDEFEKNHGTRPSYVIPPGIDPDIFPVYSNEKDIHLMAAGSLIPLKQFEIFIELITALRVQIPDLKAVLVGDGPEKKRLKAMIHQQGLESNIILTGELAYPDVIKWMQRAKVFVHLSSYEGFSGVCQEALAAGARVISFCRPMNQDIEHWEIVKDKEEMKVLALTLLQNRGNEDESIIPFKANDTVTKMMSLFEYSPRATIS